VRFDLTVNEFARDVALKRELVVYGEQFWRPYVHVRDVALAVALALEAPREAIAGKVYNVGDQGSNYRKLDLVGFLKKRFPDATVEFVHKDEDPRDYRVSFDKIAAGLNFKAERSVEDGIDEVIALLSSGLLDDPYAATYRN
jgi:nucleoside-diphosphate-sugar epimerase